MFTPTHIIPEGTRVQICVAGRRTVLTLGHDLTVALRCAGPHRLAEVEDADGDLYTVEKSALRPLDAPEAAPVAPAPVVEPLSLSAYDCAVEATWGAWRTGAISEVTRDAELATLRQRRQVTARQETAAAEVEAELGPLPVKLPGEGTVRLTLERMEARRRAETRGQSLQARRSQREARLAAELAWDGAVMAVAPAYSLDGRPWEVFVRSRTNDCDAYRLTRTPRGWVCTCLGHANHGRCWHGRAADLAPRWEAAARSLSHLPAAEVAARWRDALESTPTVRGKADVVAAMRAFIEAIEQPQAATA